MSVRSLDATTSSATTTSYLFGNLLYGGTAPLEQITTTPSGATAVFLVANQTGVQGVFNASGASEELTLYSPYGEQSVTAGTDVTPLWLPGLLQRFHGPHLPDQPLLRSDDRPVPLGGSDGQCNEPALRVRER